MHDNDRSTSHLSACQIGQLHIFLHVIPLETLLQLFVKAQIFSWCALDLNLKAKKSMLNYNVYLILFFRCFKHESYVPYTKSSTGEAAGRASNEKSPRGSRATRAGRGREEEAARGWRKAEAAGAWGWGWDNHRWFKGRTDVCWKYSMLWSASQTDIASCARMHTHTHTVTQHHKPHLLFLTSALCVFFCFSQSHWLACFSLC